MWFFLLVEPWIGEHVIAALTPQVRTVRLIAESVENRMVRIVLVVLIGIAWFCTSEIIERGAFDADVLESAYGTVVMIGLVGMVIVGWWPWRGALLWLGLSLAAITFGLHSGFMHTMFVWRNQSPGHDGQLWPLWLVFEWLMLCAMLGIAHTHLGRK